MSMSRRRSITVTRSDGDRAPYAGINMSLESEDIHLIFDLSVDQDISTSKSKESLRAQIEEGYGAFLKVLKDEGLISDSFFSGIIGSQKSTSLDTPTGVTRLE